MFSKDSKIKHVLAIFFAIGIANELSVLLNVSMPILSLVYIVGLMLVIFNYTRLKEYFWEPGLGLIGIFALLYIFFYVIDYKADIFERMSSVVSLLVWARCIRYLDEDKSDWDQEDPEINEEDENIGKI
jgi:hypothetical protein